ncbi:MAG: restriction endonuclease [Bacteroidota bacterium]
MSNNILVKKASGDLETFSEAKLVNSLKRAGADSRAIEKIVNNIQDWIFNGVTTKKIYSRAFAMLKKKKTGVAARYKLKKAIAELGPSGYPFEHFVGQIFEKLGYEVSVGVTIQGNCVSHEVDVVANKDNVQNLMECKFYNNGGKHANVQVSLYVRSRVNDIIRKRKNLPEYKNYDFEGWVVTNTRFTADSMAFGTCSGLKLLSWDYPQNNGLKDIIERLKIFPITVLTMITKKEKIILMDKGIVLCSQLISNPKVFEIIGINKNKQKKVLEEAGSLS